MDHAHAERDGTGTITLDGQQHAVNGGNLDGARIAIMQIALDTAYRTKRDLELVVTANGTMTGLRIRPNWTVLEDRSLLARDDTSAAVAPAAPSAPIPPPGPEPMVDGPPVAHDDWPEPGWLNPSHPEPAERPTARPTSASRFFDNFRVSSIEPPGTPPLSPVPDRSAEQPLSDAAELTAAPPPDVTNDLATAYEAWPAADAITEDVTADRTPDAEQAVADEPVVEPAYDMVELEDAHGYVLQGNGAPEWTPPEWTPPARLEAVLPPPPPRVAPAPSRASFMSTGHVDEGRATFITHGRSNQPAVQGWRGALNRAVGTRLEADEGEVSRRADIRTVSQHWAGPRTIAVVNGKGSAGKTPTTICLSAVFAREGGTGVLAWDNNETRGSLPWRVESAPHDATIIELLPRIEELLDSHAPYAELNHFVHHQASDKYAALFSDQSVAGDHIVTEEDVRRIHGLAARYYRLIIMDSGNNERAPNWRTMIEHASRLVVPVTNVEDTAEAGARMLEALIARGGRSASLARSALIILSQRSPGRDPNSERIIDGFTRLGHTVVTIPYDPALRTGVIRYDELRDPTKRAWLRAAAAVAENLPADPT